MRTRTSEFTMHRRGEFTLGRNARNKCKSVTHLFFIYEVALTTTR